MNLGLWILAAAGWLLVTAAGAVVGDLVSDEIRARLDRVPLGVLCLAAKRVPVDERDDLLEEWRGELASILSERRAAPLPLTRLLVGLRYATGIAWAAPKLAPAKSVRPAPAVMFLVTAILTFASNLGAWVGEAAQAGMRQSLARDWPLLLFTLVAIGAFGVGLYRNVRDRLKARRTEN